MISFSLVLMKIIDETYSYKQFPHLYSNETYDSIIKEKEQTLYSDLFLDVAYPILVFGEEKISKIFRGELSRHERELYL